jgi:RimJ/RimL family protein N-acetyltransferase
MNELPAEQFFSVQHLLGDLQQCVILNGVLDGRHAGRIFVDDSAAPSVAYVWTPWGYHYLMGNCSDFTFLSALQTKLTDELQPYSAAHGEPDILLTLIPDSWESILGDLLPTPNVLKLYRSTFTFDRIKFQTIVDQQTSIPSGFSVERINKQLAPQLVGDICATWRSVDDFLEYGLGYCLVGGHTIVSACLSAFKARGVVEIGVSTHHQYRRKGYASLTAAACIKHCLENGWIPHWECFWDNKPSIGLAQKLGFESAGEYPIYYWQGPAAV